MPVEQSADTIKDGSINKVFTAVEKTKLSAIEKGVYVRTTAYETANPTLPNVPNDSVILIVP